MTDREKLAAIRALIDKAREESLFDRPFKPKEITLEGNEVERIYRLTAPGKKKKR